MLKVVAALLKRTESRGLVRFYNRSSVSLPTLEQLKWYNEYLGLEATPDDLAQYHQGMNNFLSDYDYVDKQPDELPNGGNYCKRHGGYRPEPCENPGNAWYWRCDVKDDSPENGLLEGRTIAIKDNVAVAGVPMMNGSKLLEGFIPQIDATVVTRILKAGGRIVGKSACEDNCFSGSSHTTFKGRVENPQRKGYSAGGSSSGSAYVVCDGQVDMAIGGDQGGSIRIPSGWSGCVGLKPTYGLVPYTGAVPLAGTCDHLGPMARTVKDVSRLLEVIAGEDGLDTRQPTGIKAGAYCSALSGNLNGKRLAVIEEGFCGEDAATDDAVRKAAQDLSRAGAKVDTVSVPMHNFGTAIWSPACMEGFYHAFMNGGVLPHSKGFQFTSLAEASHKGFKTHAKDLQHIVKMALLFTHYVNNQYGSMYYSKSVNQARRLTAAYDEVLKKYDAILMPTLPTRATPFPEQNCSTLDFISHGLSMIKNTAPFDVTGHPAITIPCAVEDQLLIGLMLVGKHFDEANLLDVTYGYECLKS